MYSMQYTVPLPSDYDMGIIRDRVDRTGHLMDGFPGLRFKAFAIREKSAGAPANEYAPFYVWDDIDGMRAFCLADPGYSAIVRDFGRRPIEDRMVVELVEGSAAPAAARSLVVRRRPLPDGVAPSRSVEGVVRDFLEAAGGETVWRVAAVDVTTWEVALVDLSTRAAEESSSDAVYEVLHVSTGAPPA
jgi:hypothetical protein